MIAEPPAAPAAPTVPGRNEDAAKARRQAAKPAAKPEMSELRALRREWRNTLDQHRLVVEARFNELDKVLATSKGKRKAKHVAKSVAHLRLKPGKGRLRDLKAVDRFLEDTLEKLEA